MALRIPIANRKGITSQQNIWSSTLHVIRVFHSADNGAANIPFRRYAGNPLRVSGVKIIQLLPQILRCEDIDGDLIAPRRS